jgi:hypothetical protein
MKTLTLQDIKRKGSKAIPDNEVSYLIVNSKPKAALVPMDEYEMLVQALEDLEDRLIIEERKDEEEVSFEEIRKEYDV